MLDMKGIGLFSFRLDDARLRGSFRLLCRQRDLSDVEDIPACCADSDSLSGSSTNLSDIHHTGQRPTRTIPKRWSVPGACSLIHVMQAVGAPGTQTFFVRVGFCPLFHCKKAFCSEFSRTYHDKNSCVFSFFIKDG